MSSFLSCVRTPHYVNATLQKKSILLVSLHSRQLEIGRFARSHCHWRKCQAAMRRIYVQPTHRRTSDWDKNRFYSMKRSNHSLRATGASALFTAGVPEKIDQRGYTGHRSMQSDLKFMRDTTSEPIASCLERILSQLRMLFFWRVAFHCSEVPQRTQERNSSWHQWAGLLWYVQCFLDWMNASDPDFAANNLWW